MADDTTKISTLPLSENLDDDDLLLVVEDGVSKKAEVGYLKEVFGGGSDVSIAPSLGSGTKVADYEIDGVVGAIYVPTAPTALSQLSDDSTHRVVTDTEKLTWDGKQNALTFDDAPTASSNNPVKSGGVYTALAGKADSSGVNSINNALNIKAMSYMPSSFKTAAYENASHTRAFKWKDECLYAYSKVSAGTVSANEVTYSLSSLTLDENLVIDLRNYEKVLLIAKCTSNFISGANTKIIMRYMTTAFGSQSTAVINLPSGTNKMVYIDLNKLALENAIDIKAKPLVVFRGVGYDGHTATAAEEITVEFYGFQVTPLSNDIQPSGTSGFIYRFKPYYAHLFINTITDSANDTYVPSQSAYDIEIASRLGFNSIELNTHNLTDGNVICLHGESGKFGKEFVAADGSSYTDSQIQDTTINTVSLDWVKTNVRYKAKYSKQRVTPLILEEALYLCKTNNLVPFVSRANATTVDVCNEIMGKDNFVLYSPSLADRAKTDALFVFFGTLSESEIYDTIKKYGAPIAIGTSKYNTFTLEKWAEIVKNVHDMGGLMAFSASYMTPIQTDNLWNVGFDFAGSGSELNNPQNPNVCVISGDNGFADFTVTGGTEANGQVTMEQNGTIRPADTYDSAFLIGMWIEVTFVGSISVSMGRFITHNNSAVTSTDRKTVRFSTYALDLAPSFELKATAANTIIENIVFKASKM